MKNNYKTVLIFGLLILLSISLYLLYSGDKAKTAFVKNSDLYNEFDLKKELETKLATVKNHRKVILDSLVTQLKMASTELQFSKVQDEKEIKKFEIQKQAYMAKQQEFEEDTDRLAEQYSAQIWKQINQYVTDFGKEQGYTYIYGASGDGALMYAKEDLDLTKELIVYINLKYKGDKK